MEFVKSPTIKRARSDSSGMICFVDYCDFFSCIAFVLLPSGCRNFLVSFGVIISTTGGNQPGKTAVSFIVTNLQEFPMVPYTFPVLLVPLAYLKPQTTWIMSLPSKRKMYFLVCFISVTPYFQSAENAP